MRARFLTVIKAIAVIVFASLASAAALIAAPPGSQYTPGETLAPTCAPGDPNCSVVPPAASGINSDITSLQDLDFVGIGASIPTDTEEFLISAPNMPPDDRELLASIQGNMTGSSGTFSGIVGLDVVISSAVTGAGGTEAYAYYGTISSANDADEQLVYGLTQEIETHNLDSGYGIYVWGPDGTTSGGTQYGIYIDLADAQATRYGIYQVSNNDNYFAGRIGIGTSAPAELLDLQGVDADLDLTTFDNTNSDNSTIHLRFARGTPGAPAIVLDGDVIGETKGELYAGSSYSTVTDIVHAADCVIGANKCGALSFRTRPAGGGSPVTRMKIKSNGAIGIGTSSPDDGLVEVKGGTVCVDTNSDDSATSCITTESDIRLKKNVKPIEGALDKIMQINGVTFDWRWDEFEQISRYEAKPHDIGVIAQEVETVFPEALGEDINGYKTVDYRLLVAPLIESVKELKQENDQLKALVCLDHPDAVICQ